MELSVGDKVRVQFYPPKTTQSFVEGIIDRNEVTTYQGRCFSLKTTREVVLGHEIATPRSLPYIIAYIKEDDFEGRIQVLESAPRHAAEAAEPEAEVLPQEVVPQAEALPEAEALPQAEVLPEAEEAVDPAPEEPDGSAGEPGFLLDIEVEAQTEQEPRPRGWRRLFNRAA